MIQETILTEDFIETKKSSLKEKIEVIMSKSDEEVIRFFSDYIAWNGIFGGAVASLAGKWHNAIYITEVYHHLNDMTEDEKRGMNRYAHRVASEIFAAAEDEYNDESNINPNVRITHKDMAWNFFQGIMEYYGLKKRPEIKNSIYGYIDKTLSGYGVTGAPIGIKWLIRYLGFHIGSEKIASYEFDFLTAELERTRPDLFKFLMNRNMYHELEDNGIVSLDWLRVHGSVEEEHFQHAIKASNWAKQMVLEHDLMSEKEFDNYLSSGFNNFSRLQNSFFEKY